MQSDIISKTLPLHLKFERYSTCTSGASIPVCRIQGFKGPTFVIVMCKLIAEELPTTEDALVSYVLTFCFLRLRSQVIF